MKKVIDMHSHILPGVDDGAASYEMSMQMLRCAANDGISTIILTPHNKPGHRHIPVSEMMFGVEKLRDMMAEEAIETGLDVGLSEQDTAAKETGHIHSESTGVFFAVWKTSGVTVLEKSVGIKRVDRK